MSNKIRIPGQVADNVGEDEKYTLVTDLLYQKIIEQLRYHDGSPQADSEVDTKAISDACKWLEIIKDHQGNSLQQQHISMREAFSRKASYMLISWLIILGIIMLMQIIIKLICNVDLLNNGVLIALISTGTINLIGLFAIILKDLFPRQNKKDLERNFSNSSHQQ